jgi:hypothetical protein
MEADMSETKIEWADKVLFARWCISHRKCGPKDSHKIRTREGYIIIKFPEHPHAKPNGYIYEHRLVMEVFIGRFLEKDEHVHHINGIRSDNRIENLSLKNKIEHLKEHAAKLSKEEIEMRTLRLKVAAGNRKKPRQWRLCSCGCGIRFMTPDSKGRDKSYIQGHNNRGKHWRWSHG